jgi:hypothetical protein
MIYRNDEKCPEVGSPEHFARLYPKNPDGTLALTIPLEGFRDHAARRKAMNPQILVSAETGINWDVLAMNYKYATTEQGRDDAFEMIRQCIAVDLPESADETEGAITFLRNRGLWND